MKLENGMRTSGRYYRNTEMERKILNALRRKLESDRKGWHVTDLTCCPRKTYFRKKGIKGETSNGRILALTAGRAHHELIEISPIREVPVEKDGIKGTVDMVEERICEIYTTRRRSEDPRAFKMKLKQLMAYCYMLGRNEGDLIIFHLIGVTGSTEPKLRVYTFTFTDEELEKNWKELKRRKEIIELALMNGKPPDEKGEPWECRNCPYLKICQGQSEIL